MASVAVTFDLRLAAGSRSHGFGRGWLLKRVVTNWSRVFICRGKAAFAPHNAFTPADEFH